MNYDMFGVSFRIGASSHVAKPSGKDADWRNRDWNR
jgi:hypothetical protein